MIFPYIKNKLLTDAELQLYHFMLNNLCQIENISILTKVRLGDIIAVDPVVTSGQEFYWNISKKHIDFLICRTDTMDVICAVELDDPTHNSDKSKERDLFVEQALCAANIKLIRIKTKISDISLKDLEDIDLCINTELAPNCPFCGEKMIPTQYTFNKSRFFACRNYKDKCQYIINIDGVNLP